jgi:glycolate oxidase iron-sulfur subunit
MSDLANMLAAEEEKLLACVHCGLCLEACPTYTLTGDENDGPRGRIYLMRAVAEERLAPASNSFERHINRCLGCRACEQACPAGVEYGALLEAARSEISSRGARRGWTNRLLHLLLRRVWLHPARLRFAFSCARALRDTGLARLLLSLRLARLISTRAEFALALLQGSAAPVNSASRNDPDAGLKTPGSRSLETNDERVINREDGRESNDASQQPAPAAPALLFTGCVTEGLFARVNRASCRVLAANGCLTSAPVAQVCCGALHAHAGDLDGARILARRNIEAFTDQASAFIITNAGGCGAMLASYSHLLEDDADYAERAREFSSRVRDISQQLSETGIRPGASLDRRVVTYDASCHLLYGQHAGDAPLQMLSAIPGLNFVPLPESERCCGGAGIYNLLEPEMSGRVLEEKLARIRETKAEVLATANPGCQMQLSAGARLAGSPTLSLCHPVELLDQAYARAGYYLKK